MVVPFPQHGNVSDSAGGSLGAAQPASPMGSLAAALATTEAMVELAARGDWNAVAGLESGRRRCLEQAFVEPIASEQADLVAEALAALLHLNDQIMAFLVRARDAVLEEGAVQHRTRTALTHYQVIKPST
jgi:hypothetical protein